MSSVEREQLDNELEKIDLMGGVYELLGAFRKFWIPVVIFTLICGVTGYFRAKQTYVPNYQAYTSMVVAAGSGYEGSYYDNQTAEAMGDTFSYVATSGVLRDVVARNMGVDYIGSEITCDVLPGTNIITIYVRDADPEHAYEVLQAVIASYPEVTEYIVGPSTFTQVDDSGVPTEPANVCPTKIYTLLGVAIALLISCVLMMIYSSRRKTIMNGEDLKELTNAKMLGNIPIVRLKKRSNEKNSAILLDNPRMSSVFKESVRLVRSRLDKEIDARHLTKPVILITSSIAGEGKSLFAANLAIAVANKEKRVALVDGDLRHPSVNETLGVPAEDGDMVRFLRGECTLESMRVPYKNLSLDIYSGKTRASNAIGLIRSEEMRDFINGLKEEYDLVIIDTPPSSLLADTAGFESVADACVFVIRQDFTADRQVHRALATVTDASIPVIGYVMNGVMEGTTGFGYSSYGHSQVGYRKYGYGYGSKGYGYGYGYGEDKKKKNDTEVDVQARDEAPVVVREEPEVPPVSDQEPEVSAVNSREPDVPVVSSEEPEVFAVNSREPEVIAADNEEREIPVEVSAESED